MSAENRRTHRRFETSLSVEVYTGDDLVLARAINLSLGGVGLAMSVPISEGSTVGLCLFLVEDGVEDEREDTLNVQGRVVWCLGEDEADYQAGVRFVSLAAEHERRLKHFVDRLSGERPGPSSA